MFWPDSVVPVTCGSFLPIILGLERLRRFMKPVKTIQEVDAIRRGSRNMRIGLTEVSRFRITNKLQTNIGAEFAKVGHIFTSCFGVHTVPILFYSFYWFV